MDEGPLVNEQIDAGARFLDKFKDHYPIGAAFWIKETEDGHWLLYVASEQITEDNSRPAFGEVLRIAGRPNRDPALDPFQVRVSGMDDRLVDAALAMQKRFAAGRPIRRRGEVFGGVSVDEVYIYPLPLPVPVQ